MTSKLCKVEPEKIAGDHPFIPEMFQTVRIPITLRRYVQPAVNCQPSYCWGISEIKLQEAKNQILKSGVRRVCLSGPLLRRKSMECNAHLQVASYDKYPGPFLTASDSTRQRQSKSRLNIHLFQKCSKQPGSLSLCAGMCKQQ